jgi:hypothetical protein
MVIDNMSRARHNSPVLFSWRVTFLLVLFVGLATVALIPEVMAQGCAMCQTVMPRGDDPLARGMFWSVLLLMTMPFVVCGSIGGWIFYRHWRVRHSAPALGSTVPLHKPHIQQKEEEP